ncbi:hypothetical protein SEA_FLAPPER_74 [Gordonia phage Flapper]|uniref:Uncharacterized protein n=1 Tax=Gordonia phage Flapper TaxID=2079415 RepID=A0A2L1IXA5_9CAUD|nr:hypothetical protein KNT82_gp74 [Gordonia phage Flapper]AVD99817.1 hypothetical protein SEA_FLAPPER_74 [Gordonia phage Flapper]
MKIETHLTSTECRVYDAPRIRGNHGCDLIPERLHVSRLTYRKRNPSDPIRRFTHFTVSGPMIKKNGEPGKRNTGLFGDIETTIERLREQCPELAERVEQLAETLSLPEGLDK